RSRRARPGGHAMRLRAFGPSGRAPQADRSRCSWPGAPSGDVVVRVLGKSMDLFTPVVPLSRQHPNFQAIVARAGEPEREVIRAWSDGFSDRDGKFVQEFQTTFNSSFWELYLNAALRSLGFAIDFTRPTEPATLPRWPITSSPTSSSL